MPARPGLVWLYLINAAVLITHQIDAAFWHEWDLFRLPGGIQLFLVLNLPLILGVLYGLQALAVGRRSGIAWSWVLVGAGLFAAAFHTICLWRGDQAFRLPTSIALLVLTFVLSLLQAVALVSGRRV